MKLRRIQIENFRGITCLDLKLDDTTVLIGENNTGKTAVLDALRFALRDVRSRRGCSFDPYDFHLPNSTSDPADSPAISIRLTFQENAAGDWGDDQLARLDRAKIAQIDTNGCASVILKVGARFDEASHEFIQDWEFQNLDGAQLTNVPDTALVMLQNEVSYYYLAALREATRHFDAKGVFWRPFLKESQLSAETRSKIEEKLADVNQLIISSHGTFAQVVDRLKDIQQVVSMTGVDDFVSVDAVPSRLYDMLSKAQVNLSTCTGAKVPVARHGEGTQSLAVLTLFNAYLQAWNRGSSIVAMEEPEAHLHPSAVRALWQLINQIPGQKIISTHSGDLLSEVPSESIIRLCRHNRQTISKRMKDIPLNEKKRQQFNYHIRHARGELLFARCWILGEGETEVTLLQELARVLGRDLERSGIRCVDYRHSDISLFIEVADAMGIYWIALTDNDGQGRTDQEKVRASLGLRQLNDVLFVMPEDDVEQHLCTSGFIHIYESFLTSQSRNNINVLNTDPEYSKQLTKAVHKHKIACVHKVLEEIQGGASIPPLFERAINAAIRGANSL